MFFITTVCYHDQMDLHARNKNIVGVMFDKQPYETTICGIDVTVCKGAFPSDLGLTTTYLIEMAKSYSPTKALDMGCGLGVIAIALKKMGVPEVWAADYHEPAIECARKNALRQKNFGEITIVLSDLFENIPPEQVFDLIIFNHPYAPQNSTKRRFGKDGKGGKEVIARFFDQAILYTNHDSKILMPYSEIAGEEHNPDSISRDFNLQSTKVFETTDKEGRLHAIYEFSKN